jgi:hypothetical protein
VGSKSRSEASLIVCDVGRVVTTSTSAVQQSASLFVEAIMPPVSPRLLSIVELNESSAMIKSRRHTS